MKYVCQVCGYIYDEEKEGVPFASLPSDWKCPLCGAAKSDFAPQKEKAATELPVAEMDEELKELTPGQLSALFSNLSRGCEKQYMAKESTLFEEIADYFSSISPSIPDPTVEKLSAMLLKDIEDYRTLRAVADFNADRGAARVCVWGEKVTRMLSSLVTRYLAEGETMLKETRVWVCTVCGFVYIGESAPAQCPVCKVPAWKFEEITERSKI